MGPKNVTQYEKKIFDLKSCLVGKVKQIEIKLSKNQNFEILQGNKFLNHKIDRSRLYRGVIQDPLFSLNPKL